MSSHRVPVAALPLAFVLLGERPAPLQLVGGAVILIGVRLATLRLSRAPVVEAAARSLLTTTGVGGMKEVVCSTRIAAVAPVRRLTHRPGAD